MVRLSREDTIVAAVACLAMTIPVKAEAEREHVAVAYCRNYPNEIHLSPDNLILCFDGHLKRDQDLSIFKQLERTGQFVIRSTGGWTNTSVPIAEILMDKEAEVIIYDYCLSACANNIFFATHETYVMKDAVVAWHGVPETTVCDPDKFWIFEKPPQENPMSSEDKDFSCKVMSMEDHFYKRRNLSDYLLGQPPSAYTRKIVGSYYRATGAPALSIFWMWNPKDSDRYLKGKIKLTYEAYPKDQDEVDKIISKWHINARVVYDPMY